MNIYFSLKVGKESEEKSNSSEKQQILEKQTRKIKQMKQLATLKYNYSSPQTI